MEASNESASSASSAGAPRKIYDVRDSLPKSVSDRLDALVGRYESRVLQQKESLTRLLEERSRLVARVAELEGELGRLRRDAQGRGSW